ncbi:hypothetical protein [Sandarakinorhabdus sp. DWP1-3-1]|uniref:hypothetical protein n=1 Tax=Sandarakinorhabdus sp. DWP1-3-1 TaxID=2804627 RepID=UPI003CEB912F
MPKLARFHRKRVRIELNLKFSISLIFAPAIHAVAKFANPFGTEIAASEIIFAHFIKDNQGVQIPAFIDNFAFYRRNCEIDEMVMMKYEWGQIYAINVVTTVSWFAIRF